MPAPPTTKVLEVASTSATSSSPPASVTAPWPPAWAPIVALKAVTCPVVPLAGPSTSSEPLPRSPTVSRPAFIHSPPLTVTLPWPPANWPTSAPPSETLAAMPSSSSVPVPAPPTTTVPLAVIRSRSRTVPLLPACWPMTSAVGRGRAAERQRAAHQDEQPLPRIAHGRLLLGGQQGAAGQRRACRRRRRGLRRLADALGRDLPGERRRARVDELAHGAVAGHRAGARAEHGDVGAARAASCRRSSCRACRSCRWRRSRRRQPAAASL